MSLFDLELSREDNENTETVKTEESEQTDQSTSQPLSQIQNKGKAVREREYTAFARLLNFAQLRKANHSEIQEQYSIKIDKTEENAGSGNIRVRKISNGGQSVRYELTTKSNVKEGKIECTVSTTQANFQQFSVLSSCHMLKHRYTFDNKDGTKWEIDAVPDGNGGYYPWVRCEIEVKDLGDQVVEIPLETEEVILPPEMNKEMTQEEYDTKTQPLMDRYFIGGNPFLEKDSETQETELKTTEESTEDNNTDSDETTGEENNSEKETTGEESMSVDNITDEKEKANLVETRGEQIKEAREENNPDEEDTEDEDNENTEEDTDNETNESEEDSTEDSDSSDAEDTDDSNNDEESNQEESENKDSDDKEVSKESLALDRFIAFAEGKVDISTEGWFKKSLKKSK